MYACIFCKILDGSTPAHKICDNEKFFTFLDINPVNTGHTMIIPKHHIDSVKRKNNTRSNMALHQTAYAAVVLPCATAAGEISLYAFTI